MAGLMLLPSQEGLELLKEDLKANLKYAVLLDGDKNEITRYEFTSIYYDGDKVLTALFEVPIEENITTPMKFLRVVNGDDVVISEGETPEITFVVGVGGVQTLKFAVSGEAGEIVFKANDYITKTEFDELYLPTLEALTARVNELEKILIDKGVING
ncbi:hypothetical protein [Hydrogenimonas thermophila]|uniref:Uncharacterized protein n=1 Tax=Hydrogenimonas thermophila TaxID=223786 RepID=A0A1I5RR06_9BACT|nr:hypothetical protein [Hydrogenimonas thermophila]SFP60346.1 hypothetical protein SAMN05216234_1288 [Hydrogenimonas thermophila]